jgi:hypothetical protein
MDRKAFFLGMQGDVVRGGGRRGNVMSRSACQQAGRQQAHVRNRISTAPITCRPKRQQEHRGGKPYPPFQVDRVVERDAGREKRRDGNRRRSPAVRRTARTGRSGAGTRLRDVRDSGGPMLGKCRR